MTAYFDTSAILKLALDEDNTAKLRRYLARLFESGATPATSWLGEAEFHRGAIRKGIDVATSAQVMADFDVFEVPKEVFEQAAQLPIRHLRTLDAMHIAIALRARADAFISYDRRQGEAAAMLGLRVVMP